MAGIRHVVAIACFIAGSGASESALCSQVISVGAAHACALTPAKTIKCWGANPGGQLGDGSTVSRWTPVEVIGLGSGARSVSAGLAHTCAVTAQGGAKCWGRNNRGQLGDGTSTDRAFPVDVIGLGSGVVSVSTAAEHSCAVTTGGGAKCWGRNTSGQLGDGSMSDSKVPVDVAGLDSDVAAVATSLENTCALTSTGAIKCWGYDGVTAVNCRQEGEICIPDWWGRITCSPRIVCDYAPRYRSTAALVPGMETGYTSVAMEGPYLSNVCGMRAQGKFTCTVALGMAGLKDEATPSEAVTSFALGRGYRCFLTNQHRVHCSGMNNAGQLGDGSTAFRYPPVPVTSLPGGIVDVAASGYSTCAITAGGEAYCWGANGSGQLGDGTCGSRLSPSSVVGLDASPWPGGLTGLWWNPSESGWGLNINEQGDQVFAVLYTYEAGGSPMWLVMPSGARQPGTSAFTGNLYRVSGSPFQASPYVPTSPQDVRPVGTMTIDVLKPGSARLAYSVDGAGVAKAIEKQLFGTRTAYCVPRVGGRKGLLNFQDLWYQPAEPGWGIGIAHQDDVLFTTLFTHGPDRKDLWLVAPGARRQADGSYVGDLYRTTGPAFNAQPFTPLTAANSTKVGAMRLAFADGETGTLAYSVDGAQVAKPIVRQVFGSSAPACN